MRLALDTSSIADYRRFLRVRSLPSYRFRGSVAEYDDCYASAVEGRRTIAAVSGEYKPAVDCLFDFQRDIVRLAIRKRKFAIFADCGLGKTLMLLEYARHVAERLPHNKCVLIVSPLMVVDQTIGESIRFYGDSLPIDRVRSSQLGQWLQSSSGRIGITNYEAFSHCVEAGRLGCLIVDESSMLKSHYGKWGREILRVGAGLDWKLALTGTPAPNDRIEYANHAVFMDAFPTVNSFLARYFVNRGQTDNRWEIKPHAVSAFYRDLSHWCIFLTDPATYGWKGFDRVVPAMHVHIHDVPLTQEQRDIGYANTGSMFVDRVGGITERSRMATVSKGWLGKRTIATNKTDYIKSLVASWPDESTLIWCLYNREQVIMEDAFPLGTSISGDTPQDDRRDYIAAFKSGAAPQMITKPKILGFGLNLQVATRQVFSGLQDSYESYYQAVKRSNRYGAERPLNVHIPVTEMERPMIETVLSKARRVEADTKEQEALFKKNGALDV